MSMRSGLAAASLVFLLAVSPAAAQKAKGTLRIAFTDPISSALLHDDPKPETGLTSAAVFDTLLCFDRTNGELKPMLATSWTHVGERIIEMKLREDVKFHDGSPFDADDAVYTLNWLVDPRNNIRFGGNFDWLQKAEKVDRYTIRIIEKFPSPLALLRLSTGAPMLPSDKHSGFGESGDFGRKSPIGTGGYRVEFIDSTRGIMLVRNPDYPQGGACTPKPSIERVHLIPIPDAQTQIAQLMTDGVDLIRITTRDQAEMLGSNPAFSVTASQAITFHYMAMDAIGRSGNAALQKFDVRKALVQALDRQRLAASVVPGGDAVRPVDSFCFPIQRGCSFTNKPYPYDVAAAKKLLVDAGYPNGFDVEINATPGSYDLGEAIAGELRRVGVRATVARLTFGAYRQRQREGKQQILVGQWTNGGFPDVSGTADFFFNNGDRDYWRDPEINTFAHEALSTVDEVIRRRLYARIFDRANAQAYVLPISTKPDVFVHTRDLEIATGSLNVFGSELSLMRWK
ncbi:MULTISPECIES: ABC transporter substrate-binding protein [unclassified Beijerinckia]|uniref:ABC transporter substrate-binding protein n=1 Tax=unclassified Beijerinckia TaxID=2638183 RepID=UPI000895956F|nr:MULTISPECIES: ABC transporter substrate-binding protein [unclassified Beijerinckia]MDH7796740.1 peptide/nickel transport system substrate-binding protein [Beijerinckia sp. GAS462]SEC57944.1 peptide/nickel transport system substrate-binding protein [Beijerinckia sp. 28-YEA-48]